MRYIINAHASEVTGTGHVMRLSALAEELIYREKEVFFVGGIQGISWLKNRVINLGFTQVIFNERDFIPNADTDILIFDSYEKSLHDGFIQRSYWKNTVLVADSSTPKYQADLVFHPNIIEESLDFDNSDFHSGPLYIPFRKSIAKINSCHEENTKLRILIVGGGTDPLNFVGNMGLLLSQMKETFQVSLLTNKNSLDFLDSRFETIQIGSSFDSLVASSDLVFTTAGSASFEFVAKGIAIGIGCAVQNQEKNYKNLVNLGMALPIGDHFLGKWKFDSRAINELINDEEIRMSLRVNCNNFLDFEGASRIVDLILKL